MSILTDIIPSTWRKAIYATYAIALALIGVANIVFDGDPNWIQKVEEVVQYIGIVVGATAASNITGYGARRDADSSTGYSAGNDGPSDVTPGEPVVVEAEE